MNAEFTRMVELANKMIPQLTTDAGKAFGQQLLDLLRSFDLTVTTDVAGRNWTRYGDLEIEVAQSGWSRGDGNRNAVTVEEEHMLTKLAHAANATVFAMEDTSLFDIALTYRKIASKWIEAGGNGSRLLQMEEAAK